MKSDDEVERTLASLGRGGVTAQWRDPAELRRTARRRKNMRLGGLVAKTLQTSSLSSEQQDAGWTSLMADLVIAGKKAGISLQSANSLWLQEKLPMEPDFMTAMARYFETGVWQVDFTQDLPGAVEAI